MREFLAHLDAWDIASRRYALAVVTETGGSSPRPAGSWMAVRDDGLVVGSVSGGCVETAVVEAALRATKTGDAEWLTFDRLDPDDVWTVGLSCGGRIRVLVKPCFKDVETWRKLRSLVAADEPHVFLASLDRHEVWIPGASEDLMACGALRRRETFENDGVAFVVGVPRPRLLIVGAVHIAEPLIAYAKELGFHTVLIDPREGLADMSRFPVAPDRVEIAWPDKALAEIPLASDAYAVLLTHDPKIDDAALRVLLRKPVAYIGALGSHTTHAQRRERLMAEGFSAAEVDRIRGPVGLAIGAKSPAEIALSIAAEIVQVRRRG